ncbi:hypothetical protein Tco_0870451 [Tanacetum coccineum]
MINEREIEKKNSICPASRAGASSDYARFSLLQTGRRANYNMHSLGKTVNELHGILKLHEQNSAHKPKLQLYMQFELGKGQKGQWHEEKTVLNYIAELVKKKKNAALELVVQVIFAIETQYFLKKDHGSMTLVVLLNLLFNAESKGK